MDAQTQKWGRGCLGLGFGTVLVGSVLSSFHPAALPLIASFALGFAIWKMLDTRLAWPTAIAGGFQLVERDKNPSSYWLSVSIVSFMFLIALSLAVYSFL
ncbi:hypothetical protein BSZ36_05905 [Rubricoccus marinus]|uniref:Uncharacterized protein n=2 Tax=Rubricoccus marinus TaxID=716817 RepID=A0A259TXY0_9BACT|nr:hypothetical protein BSZ36_05905 [Rubricoccus marinus]